MPIEFLDKILRNKGENGIEKSLILLFWAMCTLHIANIVLILKKTPIWLKDILVQNAHEVGRFARGVVNCPRK